MKKAVYDLLRYPANFNFMEFLGAAVAYGASHVCFDTRKGIRKKFSEKETEQRISSILIPCCDLMGVTFSDDHYELDNLDIGNLIDPGYHISALLKAHREVGRIGMIKKLHQPANASPKYTVTLRNYDRYPFRNSNVEAWMKFADRVGAVIIPDFYDKPIKLEDKVDLWAQSKMNFFVNNGPAIMSYLSDIPYISFFKWHDRDYHLRHGFPEGSQFPWASDKQRILWQTDSYDHIMRAFEKYCPV